MLVVKEKPKFPSKISGKASFYQLFLPPEKETKSNICITTPGAAVCVFNHLKGKKTRVESFENCIATHLSPVVENN